MDKEMLGAIAELLQPINNRLERMETDLSGVKEDLAGVKSELAQVKEDGRHTRILLEATNKNVKLLCEAQSANAEKLQQLDRIEATLNDVKSDTEVLKDVVSWHSADIKKLKQA